MRVRRYAGQPDSIMARRVHHITVWLLMLLPVLAQGANGADGALLGRLATLAPELDRRALELALTARQCAIEAGRVAVDGNLAVIDYSLPSTNRRLWLFDVPQARLLLREYVAHGRGSGGNVATRFSNRPGSHMSSLGGFAAAETYSGKHGLSLRLDGLVAALNGNARERAVVIHGADYVSASFIRRYGRLGRSFGCPALPLDTARTVIDALAGGGFVYVYHNGHLAELRRAAHCPRP